MALSKARNTPMRKGEVFGFPVKAGAVIHQGALVVLNGGYAAPGSTATGLIAIGRAEAEADNSAGANGDIQVEVRRGVFQFGNSASGDLIAQANAGADCYMVDDETVALTNGSNTRSRAGQIAAVDDDGVWVQIGLGQ